MKLSISRITRFNTGNFTFIENKVGLEDDVTKENYKDKYKALSNILDGTLTIENLKQLDEINSANKIIFSTKKEDLKIDDYIKSLGKAIPEISKSLEDNLKTL